MLNISIYMRGVGRTACDEQVDVTIQDSRMHSFPIAYEPGSGSGILRTEYTAAEARTLAAGSGSQAREYRGVLGPIMCGKPTSLYSLPSVRSENTLEGARETLGRVWSLRSDESRMIGPRMSSYA